jgi:hypothetical protein
VDGMLGKPNPEAAIPLVEDSQRCARIPFRRIRFYRKVASDVLRHWVQLRSARCSLRTSRNFFAASAVKSFKSSWQSARRYR